MSKHKDKEFFKLEHEQKELAKKVADNPKDYKLLFKLAKINKITIKEKVIPYFVKVLSINPSHSPSFYELGRCYQKRSEFKTAIAYYQKVKYLVTTNDELYHKAVLRIGECNFQQGFYIYALNTWKEYPLFFFPKYQVIAISNLLIYHLFFDQNFSNVPKLLKFGLEIDSKNRLLRSFKIFHRIVISRKRDPDSIRKGINSISKIITEKEEKNIDFPIFHFLLARLQIIGNTTESFEKGVKELEIGILKKKKFFQESCYLLGLKFVLLGKLNKFDFLAKEEEKIVEMRRKNIFQLHYLSQFRLKYLNMKFRTTKDPRVLEKLLKACEESLNDENLYEQILVIHPKILVEISDIYRMDSKKWIIGYEMIQRADLILPNCYSIQILLGWYKFFYLGEEKEGLYILKRLRKRFPSGCLTYRYLGDMYFKKNEFEKSVEQYKICMENEDEDYVEMDKLEDKLKLAVCYHNLDEQVHKHEMLDEILEDVTNIEEELNKQNHNMFLSKLYVFDNSFKKAYRYFKRINPSLKSLNTTEKIEYYNLKIKLLTRLKMKKEVIGFYDKYFAPKKLNYDDLQVSRKLTYFSKLSLARSLLQFGKDQESEKLFKKVRKRLLKKLKFEKSGNKNIFRMKDLEWEIIQYYIVKSHALLSTRKYHDSLKELGDADLYIQSFVTPPKEEEIKVKEITEKEVESEDDEENESKKKKEESEEEEEETEEVLEEDDLKPKKFEVSKLQKQRLRQIGFLRAHNFEKLNVIPRCVTEYSKLILSFQTEEYQKHREKELIKNQKNKNNNKVTEGTELRDRNIQIQGIIGKERHDYYLTALDNRAHCYIALGQHQKAIQDFTRIYHPEDPRSYLHAGILGLIYFKVKIVPLALKWFTHAINHLNTTEKREKCVVTERRSLYSELFDTPTEEESNNNKDNQQQDIMITETAFHEKYIFYLFNRGIILFSMRNYKQTVEDMNLVLEYYRNLGFPKEHEAMIKESFQILGSSFIHINRGLEGVKVFSEMIKEYPKDDVGYLSRSRAHFVEGKSLRESLDDLLSACRINTEKNREEKKNLLQDYLKAVRRLFNRQIESEFSLSKKLFEVYLKNSPRMNNSFKIVFDDDDVPVEERCIYIHPLFTYVSEYLKREYVAKGTNSLILGIKKKDNPEVWESYLILRDWLMCLGINEEQRVLLIRNFGILEQTFYLARKFEVHSLMNYIIREFNPFIAQEFLDPLVFKKQILKLSIRLIVKNEVESMLFLNCLGYFKYLVDVDKRKSKIMNLKRAGSQGINNEQQIVKESDFIFTQGELTNEENEIRLKLVEMVKKVNKEGENYDLTPVDYLRQLLVNHPNFQKKKTDSQPSTVYENLLTELWEVHDERLRNLWFFTKERTIVTAHTEVILSRMSYFRENFKLEDFFYYGSEILEVEGNDNDDNNKRKRKGIKEIVLGDIPEKVLNLMMGFCYKERVTVRNFDIKDWGGKGFDDLLKLVRKYKMDRFEIVLVLKYLKDFMKEW